MIKLLLNEGDTRLESVLNKCFKDAKEVRIAVSFMKLSGLILIRSSLVAAIQEGKKVSIITGTDYGKTEPEALEAIWTMFLGTKCELRLAENEKTMFNPKLYSFSKEGSLEVIIGSANLSGGGLNNNNECSVHYQGKPKCDFASEINTYWDKLLSGSRVVTEEMIEDYKTFFNEQKPTKYEVIRKPGSKDLNLVVKLDKLRKYYDNHGDDFYRDFFIYRGDNYAEAKRLLDQFCEMDHVNHQDFATLMHKLVTGKARLWGSNGLWRQKAKYEDKGIAFQKLAKTIRDNCSAEPEELFDKGRRIIRDIPGVGFNVLTEVMITYNPYDYAILNNASHTPLKHIVGTHIKGNVASFTGKDYARFCQLIQHVRESFGLKDMMEADCFLESYYRYSNGTFN
ncbi:MAG: phospholipase D-like domain-containing protein [Candidatus Cloacimonadaceae bacterium]|jgi:HKD family nuclease|nr:phospholipase D-like domain-containing protein [Candidatus Cloacimonadaceae bacterium]